MLNVRDEPTTQCRPDLKLLGFRIRSDADGPFCLGKIVSDVLLDKKSGNNCHEYPFGSTSNGIPK